MMHPHHHSRDHRRRLGASQVQITLPITYDLNIDDQRPDTYLNETTTTFGYASWRTAYLKGLLLCDLSSLAGKTIVAAALHAYALTGWGGNVYITMHRILPANDWDPAAATWNNRKAGTGWTGAAGCSTAGTDYDATSAIDEYYYTYVEEWKDIPFNAGGLADLQYMALDPANNQGLVIQRGPSGGQCNRFASVSYATASLRPSLVVTYEP